MRCSSVILSVGFSLVTVASFVSLSSAPVTAAEETLLLCEGSTRNTARVYRSNGTLMMRVFDRQTNKVWFNSEARSQTSPESTVYSNVRGEASYKVSTFRNSSRDCSITIGNQPPERGTVKGGGNPPTSNEETLLLCEGNTRSTARVYRSNGALTMRLFDRQTNKVWFNGAARNETNPESIIYSNARGEASYKVSTFRNGSRDCSITIGNQTPERGMVK